ncbi:ATP-binding protein [Nocardia farcinica]
MPGSGMVRWRRTRYGECTVLRPAGVLDVESYRRFGDDLVKFAVEEPRALIVALDDLVLGGSSMLTAFSAARARVREWPGVPILLVVAEEADRRAVRAALPQTVPVVGSVPAAAQAVDPPSRQRSERLALYPDIASPGRARRFLRELCRAWGVEHTEADAELVVTELVENALVHGRGDLDLRVELRPDALTVAVADADPHAAVLREAPPGRMRRHGLHAVAAIARAWGCAPRWPSGKVVWASLPIAVAPGLLRKR